jgi:serine/threonine protein phosphatase PrpC
MITAFPEIIEENLSDADFVFIGCDGVWDCMTNQEVGNFIYERLKKNPNVQLSKILEDILDKCCAVDLYSGKI